MVSKEIHNRLAAQHALLSAQNSETDDALAAIRGKTDPDSLRAQLEILLDADREHDAAELVREATPHITWCDLAISALILDHKLDAADRIYRWAREHQDVLVRRRCALAYAQAMFALFFREHAASGRPETAPLFPEEKRILRRILQERLDAIIPIAQANGTVESGLESLAIQLAIRCHYLLGERLQCDSLARLLASRHPISLRLAELSLSHVVEPDSDWPERLRTEHPDSFHAQWLAVAIEALHQHKHRKAFQTTCDLVTKARTPEERVRLYGLLHELEGDLGSDTVDVVDSLAPDLLAGVPDLLALRRAERLLREKKPDAAKPILDEAQDKQSAVWLQLHSYYLDQKGDVKGSLAELLKCAAIVETPPLFYRTAAVAHRAGDLKTCATMLGSYLRQIPDDVGVRQKLASALLDLSDYPGAAEQFGELRRRDPGDPWHGFNQAACLARAGQDEAALKVYESLCDDANPSLEAYVARAYELKRMERPQDAFASLSRVRDAFWDTPEYLTAFMDIAFAANAESEAGEAMGQMNKLRAAGRVDPELFRLVSMDEITEQMQDGHQRHQEMNQQLLKGQVPWLVVDRMQNQPSYRAWAYRTQPIRWLSDVPDIRADLCIYATNSYTVYRSSADLGSLEAIACPPRDMRVVADISALMTLHQLELLDKAADYFGVIDLPSVYDFSEFHDRSQLLQHQPSERTATKELRVALDDKTLGVREDVGATGQRPVPYVKEHTFPDTDKEHYYRLCDILSPLHEEGLLEESLYRDALRRGVNPSGVDDCHPPLAIGDSLLIDDYTLVSLSKAKVLPVALKAFELSVSREDEVAIRDTVDAYETSDKIKGWHADLWGTVRNNSKFVHSPCPPLSPRTDRTEPTVAEPFLAAVNLAEREGIPLLVDDRCCQAIALNASATNTSAAFGTDALVLAMWRDGMLGLAEASDALIKLLELRYRFIVLPPEVLKELCDRYAQHPPGLSLRTVADYVHDCMRDPGLFGGFEQTSPPVSIAHRFYQQWTTSIAEFTIDIWSDGNLYDEARARIVTEWAMKELLPSPPKCLGPGSAVVASLSHQMVMARAMLRAAFNKDEKKAHMALRAIGNSLGLSPEAFLRSTTEVLHAT